jgi:hypothetical protein
VESNQSQTKVTVRDLFPGLSDDQLKEVEETLHDYAAIAWRVCERLECEKPGAFDGGRTNP